MLAEAVADHLPRLRAAATGRRIAARIRQRFPELPLPSVVSSPSSQQQQSAASLPWKDSASGARQQPGHLREGGGASGVDLAAAVLAGAPEPMSSQPSPVLLPQLPSYGALSLPPFSYGFPPHAVQPSLRSESSEAATFAYHLGSLGLQPAPAPAPAPPSPLLPAVMAQAVAQAHLMYWQLQLQHATAAAQAQMGVMLQAVHVQAAAAAAAAAAAQAQALMQMAAQAEVGVVTATNSHGHVQLPVVPEAAAVAAVLVPMDHTDGGARGPGVEGATAATSRRRSRGRRHGRGANCAASGHSSST